MTFWSFLTKVWFSGTILLLWILFILKKLFNCSGLTFSCYYYLGKFVFGFVRILKINLMVSDNANMKKTKERSRNIPVREQQRINPISYRSHYLLRLVNISSTKNRSKSVNPRKYNKTNDATNLFLNLLKQIKQTIRKRASMARREIICAG